MVTAPKRMPPRRAVGRSGAVASRCCTRRELAGAHAPEPRRRRRFASTDAFVDRNRAAADCGGAFVALIAVTWFAGIFPRRAVDGAASASATNAVAHTSPPPASRPVTRLETPAVESTGSPTTGVTPVPKPVPDERLRQCPRFRRPRRRSRLGGRTRTAPSKRLDDLRTLALTQAQTGARAEALTHRDRGPADRLQRSGPEKPRRFIAARCTSECAARARGRHRIERRGQCGGTVPTGPEERARRPSGCSAQADWTPQHAGSGEPPISSTQLRPSPGKRQSRKRPRPSGAASRRPTLCRRRRRRPAESIRPQRR